MQEKTINRGKTAADFANGLIRLNGKTVKPIKITFSYVCNLCKSKGDDRLVGFFNSTLVGKRPLVKEI